MISKDIAFLCGLILFIIITVLFFTLRIEWLGYVFMIGIAVIMVTYIKFYIIKEDPDKYNIDTFYGDPVDDWDKKKESED